MTDVFVRTTADAGGDGTTNTDSSGDGSHAYNSLTVAEAAEQGDITLAASLDFQCFGGADSGATTFDAASWTVDATHFVTISAQVSRTAAFNASNYHKITSGNYQDLISIEIPFTVTDGLQFKVDHIGSTCIKATRSIQAINNIGEGSAGANKRGFEFVSTGTVADLVAVVNNVFYDFGHRALDLTGSNSNAILAIYNNTLPGNDIGIFTSSTHAASSRIFNNIITGSTTDYSTNGTFTTDNNLSSDATSPNTAHRSKTVTYTDAVNDDYSTGDADVVTLGTDLTSDSLFPFSTDCLGVSKGSNWDMGAFQDVGVGGVTIPVIMNHLRNQGVR